MQSQQNSSAERELDESSVFKRESMTLMPGGILPHSRRRLKVAGPGRKEHRAGTITSENQRLTLNHYFILCTIRTQKTL